jgi:hypothetical protein
MTPFIAGQSLVLKCAERYFGMRYYTILKRRERESLSKELQYGGKTAYMTSAAVALKPNKKNGNFFIYFVMFQVNEILSCL